MVTSKFGLNFYHKNQFYRATKAKMNSLLGTNSQNKKQVHLHSPDEAKKS